MSSQDHKASFITGASSGLGQATAKLFASKGWKVIASMRDPSKEKELGRLSGVTLMALDVTDPHQIESVATQVVGSGGVDAVFNNAGYAVDLPAMAFKFDLGDWHAGRREYDNQRSHSRDVLVGSAQTGCCGSVISPASEARQS